MGTIAQQIVRLQGAKGDIKTAIHAQGVLVPSEVKMDGIAPYIEQINTGVHDLSFYDVFGNFKDEQTTANSYVVREAGKYKIPLVYGCGIKDGWSNPASFTRQGTTYTADFVNYKGNVITSPYIETDTAETAASAGLLWQTAVGMITSVSLVNGVNCRYLQFNVGSVPTTNGLAVLWIKDGNGDIMWSWTIWCCADAITSVILTNYTNVQYEVLSLQFGAIWNSERTYYMLPYYQWGRKDLTPPIKSLSDQTPVNLYNIDGTNYTDYGLYGVAGDSDAGGTTRSIANSIKMPEKLFRYYSTSTYSWNNLQWMANFWNAASTEDSNKSDNQHTALKTIYDPMPPGFMVPCYRFSTGFSKNGSSASDVDNMNVVGSWSYGWAFKKNATDDVGLFFPALGYRASGSGSISSGGSTGYYWCYSYHSGSLATGFYFASNSVTSSNNMSYATGFPILPTKDLVQNNIRPVQIIKNGNFANGTTDWTNYSASQLSITTDGYSKLEKISSNYSGAIAYQSQTVYTDHQYYCKFVGNAPLEGISIFAGFAAENITVGGNTQGNISYDGTGNFVTNSWITSPKTNTAVEVIRVGTSAAAVGSYGYFKSFMVIDLTATFGAGNEPTKEECDIIFQNDYYEYYNPGV